MPRIPDTYRTNVVYLYPSKEAAESREDLGGTGFVIGYPPDRLRSDYIHPYVVTAAHVLDGIESPVVRVNLLDGTSVPLTTAKSDWKRHKDHDVAICYLSLDSETPIYEVTYMHKDALLTRGEYLENNIGLGDDLFLVGRFVLFDDSTVNRPVMRWGTYAAPPNPEYPYEVNGQPQPEAFLAEIRSRPGLSGSQVGVARFATHTWVDVEGGTQVFRPITKIIGVDCAFVPDHGELWREDDHGDSGERVDGLYTREASGLSVVVPSWKVIDLLEDPDVIEHRKNDEEETLSRGEGKTMKVEPASSQEPPMSRADFLDALGKVSRPDEPQPDEASE